MGAFDSPILYEKGTFIGGLIPPFMMRGMLIGTQRPILAVGSAERLTLYSVTNEQIRQGLA